MTCNGVSPTAMKEEAATDQEVRCPLVQDTCCASPCTSGADQSTPFLTPSSEYSEIDLLTPSAPKEFEYSPLPTPSKPPKGSHFAQTCFPLKIQLRTSENDQKDHPSKTLWDVSLDLVTASCRLFDYEPPPVTLTEEAGTPPSVSFTTKDFYFSSKLGRRTCQRSGTGRRLSPITTPTKSQVTPAVNTSAKSAVPIRLVKKSTLSKTGKPLEDVLARLLPRDVLVRLRDDIGRCVAETASKPTHQCQNRPSKQSLRATVVIEMLRAIDDVNTASVTTLFDKVSQILPKVLCTQGKHARIAMDALREVESKLSEAGEKEKVKLELEIRVWLRDLVEAHAPKTNISTQHGSNEKACALSDAEQSAGGAMSYPVRRSTRLREADSSCSSRGESAVSSYRPYHANGSPEARLSVSELIRQRLERPLLDSERKEGFLYVFWRRGDFGLIKIGYTTCSTDKRLDEWQRQCGGEIEDCHTEDQSSQIRVRNVRRLESLVHAELKDYRKPQLNCRGCHKDHKEWFDVDVAMAHKVVDKWTNWFLAEERYEDCTRGKLLALEEVELATLCTPAKLEPSPPPAVPASGRRRSSGRARSRSILRSRLVDNPWAALAGQKHSWATESSLQ